MNQKRNLIRIIRTLCVKNMFECFHLSYERLNYFLEACLLLNYILTSSSVYMCMCIYVYIIRGEARGNVMTHRIARSNCIYAAHAASFIACLCREQIIVVVRSEVDIISQATWKNESKHWNESSWRVSFFVSPRWCPWRINRRIFHEYLFCHWTSMLFASH